MAEFNETLVRRYYELQGYLVRGNVRYRLGNGYSDVDLVAVHPKSNEAVAVEVKGWHTEPLITSSFRDWPSLLNFTTDAATEAVRSILGDRPFKRVLVVSKVGAGSADQVRQFLAEREVEVLEFVEVLRGLMAETNTNKNADSDAEHLLRLLRIYGFLPTSGSGAQDENAVALDQSAEKS